jgi:hypothetical protein
MCPYPTGWEVVSDLVVEIRKIAVERKINPLGSVRPAQFGLSLLPTLEPRDASGIEDYRKSCVSIQNMETIS